MKKYSISYSFRYAPHAWLGVIKANAPLFFIAVNFKDAVSQLRQYLTHYHCKLVCVDDVFVEHLIR